MKDKSKVLKTYRYMFDKLQFIGLIEGRVLTWGRRAPQLVCVLDARPKHFAHNLLQA